MSGPTRPDTNNSHWLDALLADYRTNPVVVRESLEAELQANPRVHADGFALRLYTAMILTNCPSTETCLQQLVLLVSHARTLAATSRRYDLIFEYCRRHIDVDAPVALSLLDTLTRAATLHHMNRERGYAQYDLVNRCARRNRSSPPVSGSATNER
jgi:hypothetical protein